MSEIQNKIMKNWRLILIVAVAAVAVWYLSTQVDLSTVWQQLFGRSGGDPTTSVLPTGFKQDVVAEGLNKPRVVVFDSKDRLLVSELGANKVTIFDSQPGGTWQGRTLIDKLRSPHGLDFYTDKKTGTTYLYIAEAHRVARYIYNNEAGSLDVSSAEVIATFTADGRHTTRTILFGPNLRSAPIVEGGLDKEVQLADKLYISVGSSCDACVETSWKRGALLEADPLGTFLAEFAGGLRNAVFFAFHPKTGQIWATEMGRDNLGDNLPPDEINIVKPAVADTPFGALRYGWPFCYGKQIKDTAFKPDPYTRIDIPTDCQQTEPSYIDLPAHSAPLGLAFITDKNWPADWQDDLLVAYHGSWNRSEPTGYKIIRFVLDPNGNPVKAADGKPVVEDFINWLDGEKITGRPVDLKFHQGKLYVTDDHSGKIYRISPHSGN